MTQQVTFTRLNESDYFKVVLTHGNTNTILELLAAKVPVHIVSPGRVQLSRSSAFISRALSDGKQVFVLVPSSLYKLLNNK